MDKKPWHICSLLFVTFNIEIAISCLLIANFVDTFVARKIPAQVNNFMAIEMQDN